MYAPDEDKDEGVKVDFYDQWGNTVDQAHKLDMD